MKILKTGCGNDNEAFIEDRFTEGVNIIFSNDNNKGKTIIFQGLMYALGNDPIFPSGFDYKTYYFYTKIEHNGKVYEFLRKNNNIVVKNYQSISIFHDISELKYYVTKNIFELPYIVKDGFQKLVDPSLFYQLFFIGQDKRNPSNVINSSYYNKKDFTNMIYSMTRCLTLPDSDERLKRSRSELRNCKTQIDELNKRLTFYQEHPEIANTVSKTADRKSIEKERQDLQALNETISIMQRKRTRLINRKIKLQNLITELNSVNIQLNTGEIRCQDCGSLNITYTSGDLSFELTNDLVRKNIMKSISDSIELYSSQIIELQENIDKRVDEINQKIKKVPQPIADILVYTDTIRTYSEDEKHLIDLYNKRDTLESEIKEEQKNQELNAKMQFKVKSSILANMNVFYKLIDPDGTQEFKDFFATRNMTFSGSEEQEYYFSRTLAIFWSIKHCFPIIMDCFRKGELSTKKENTMIDEYKKTGTQVILSSTLKDEEYSTGAKYYDIPNVNAINYESNPNSHILQEKISKEFMDIVNTFGVVI
jgi:hypothetical protein